MRHQFDPRRNRQIMAGNLLTDLGPIVANKAPSLATLWVLENEILSGEHQHRKPYAG